ncbi:MAG: hypothetical protein COB98_11000 [Flavobacteriaceae bacterium]|nr:MAG: hypothetical protein COB98_11000 [Flavobacteriaceae bacterium]
MLVTILTASFTFTSCDKDDDEDLPIEKTAEEIAAENLAEFKDLIGTTGVSNLSYELAMSMEPISSLVGDEFDKLAFDSRNDEDGSTPNRFFKFDDSYTYNDSGMSIKGSVFTFEKKDGVFTLFAKLKDAKKAFFGKDLIDDGEFEFKVTYNIQTKLVTTFQSGYQQGYNTGTVIIRYTATPYVAQAKAAKKKSVKRSTAALTGVHYVSVELSPAHWSARFPAYLLQPKGKHYVKFSPKSNGETNIQFCDASGNVSGNNYNYGTTHHFWKNRMPMAVNLAQVDFTFNRESGSISQGTGVMARARKNYSPRGITPPFFGGRLTNQDSGSEATIITTHNNSATSFKIEINLDFDVKFHCIITK